VFADEGTYIVTLTATDTSGAATQQTLTVTVNNVAPIVKAGADFTTDEGTAIAFNGNFTDPGMGFSLYIGLTQDVTENLILA